MPRDAERLGRIAAGAGLALVVVLVGAALWSSPNAWPYVLGATAAMMRR